MFNASQYLFYNERRENGVRLERGERRVRDVRGLRVRQESRRRGQQASLVRDRSAKTDSSVEGCVASEGPPALCNSARSKVEGARERRG